MYMYVTIKEQPCISNTNVGYYKLRYVRWLMVENVICSLQLQIFYLL